MKKCRIIYFSKVFNKNLIFYIHRSERFLFKHMKIFILKLIFPGSQLYWNKRYLRNGNSGKGSNGKLADFKAEVINKFINEKKILSIIEYGCGDGNQLKLLNVKKYLGYDISPAAIKKCKELFIQDTNKKFYLSSEYNNEKATLTLSLDVIYHLPEDNIFTEYMNRLFASSNKYVIIYSSNTEKNKWWQPSHIKYRKFTKYIEKMFPNWKLVDYFPNKYPCTRMNPDGSLSNFYIYEIASHISISV